MSDGTIYTTDVSALNIDTNTTVASGAVAGDTLTLTMDDASTVDIDVTTLNVDTNNYVVSGAVVGTVCPNPPVTRCGDPSAILAWPPLPRLSKLRQRGKPVS